MSTVPISTATATSRSTPQPTSSSSSTSLFSRATAGPVSIVIFVLVLVAIGASLIAFLAFIFRRIHKYRERRRQKFVLEDGGLKGSLNDPSNWNEKGPVKPKEFRRYGVGGDSPHSRWLLDRVDDRQQSVAPSRLRGDFHDYAFGVEGAYSALPITRDDLRGEDRYSASKSSHSSQNHSDHNSSRSGSARSGSREKISTEELSTLGPLPNITHRPSSYYKLQAAPIRPLASFPTLHPTCLPSPSGPRSFPTPGLPSRPLPLGLYSRESRTLGPRPYLAGYQVQPLVTRLTVASVSSPPHIVSRPVQPLTRQVSIASASSVWSRSTAPSERTRHTSRLLLARRNRAMAGAV
jgi:hypothetical protein